MPKSKRGFGGMAPDRLREIASQGGKAVHEQGTGHEFTSEEARAAGRLGGKASGAAKRAAKEKEKAAKAV